MGRRGLVAVIVAVCLLVPATAGATTRNESTHTRLAASSLHVHVDHRVTFTVRLRSAWTKCFADQPLKWFRNGVYVRTVMTNARGRVEISRRLHGTVTFQAKHLGRRWGQYPNRYVCYASQSRRVTVEVGH
jgi:hypothetical protein